MKDEPKIRIVEKSRQIGLTQFDDGVTSTKIDATQYDFTVIHNGQSYHPVIVVQPNGTWIISDHQPMVGAMGQGAYSNWLVEFWADLSTTAINLEKRRARLKKSLFQAVELGWEDEVHRLFNRLILEGATPTAFRGVRDAGLTLYELRQVVEQIPNSSWHAAALEVVNAMNCVKW